MSSPRHFALIPASGSGSRMQGDFPKQYLELAGKPMLSHVLDAFRSAAVVRHVYVVVAPDDTHIDGLKLTGLGGVTVLRKGGATRRDSVLNGLIAMEGAVAEDDWVLVHDAARPGISAALIGRLAQALRGDPVGGLLALPLVDTVKRADTDARAEATLNREGLWAAQTPQMFRYGVLRRALEQSDGVTDEAGAIEALGLRPRLVEGSPRNTKVTLPGDIALVECMMKALDE